MSGQGNPPQPPPSRTLVSLRAAEPFVDNTGRLTGWARQFLQRLISLVGPPVPGDTQTIIEQLTTQSTGLTAFEAQVAAEIAALEAEIAGLEMQIIALQSQITSIDAAPPLPTGPLVAPYIAVIETDGAAGAGLYSAGQELCNFRVGAAVIFPRGLSTSYVDTETAPAGNASGPIMQNGGTLGTYTVLAGNTAGSFSFAANGVYDDGDFLKCYAPAVADAAMTGLRLTLVGTRQP